MFTSLYCKIMQIPPRKMTWVTDIQIYSDTNDTPYTIQWFDFGPGSADLETGNSYIHYSSTHRQAALSEVHIVSDNKRSQVPAHPWLTL